MSRKVIVERSETEEAVTIPFHLAKLLASEPKDFKNPAKYDEVQSVAKKLLQVLLSVKD